MPVQQPYQQPVPAYQPPGATTGEVLKKSGWQHFAAAFKKYAVFKGRARRAEFWWFFLFSLIFEIALLGIGGLLGVYDVFSFLGSALFFLPTWAVWWRRMHDVNKGGAFCLIPIYNLVLAFTAGNTGPNRFGPDPKTNSL
jgi:uncharacterized membrane protein YhaH (DUF805 family)